MVRFWGFGNALTLRLCAPNAHLAWQIAGGNGAEGISYYEKGISYYILPLWGFLPARFPVALPYQRK